MALQAALDDGSQPRRSGSEGGEGWQLLQKLTTHVRSRLEAMSAKPGGGASSPLATAAARAANLAL